MTASVHRLACAWALVFGLACTPTPSTSTPNDAPPTDPTPSVDEPKGASTTDRELPLGYPLVYHQDFDAPASVADLVFANPGEWALVADADPPYLELSGSSYEPPQASPHAIAVLDGLRVGSFVMDLELQQTSPDGDAHRDLCLLFGFTDPSAYYYAHVSTQHDPVAHNVHIVDHADRRPITTNHSGGYDWGRDRWKRLRLTRDAETGRITVVDLANPEVILLDASDTTFTKGHVGFGSFDNTGRIKSMTVWAPQSTVAKLPLGPPWGGL